MSEDLVRIEISVDVPPDEDEGIGKPDRSDREDLGRCALDQLCRRNSSVLGLALGIPEPFVEGFGGRVSDSERILVDGREGRIRKSAQERVVVNAEDGYFPGDGDAGRLASLEYVPGEEIVCAKDGDRLFKSLQPLGERPLVEAEVEVSAGNQLAAEPLGRVDLALEDPAVKAIELECADEGFPPGGGKRLSGIAAEGEVLEPVFNEMTGGELADSPCVLVGGHEFPGWDAAVDVDDGASRAAKRPEHGPVPDAGDEAVKARKRRAIPQLRPFGKVQGPVALCAGVLGDALAKASPVVPVALDDESNPFHRGELYHTRKGVAKIETDISIFKI